MTAFAVETWARPAVLPFLVPTVLFVVVTAMASRAPLGAAARVLTAILRVIVVLACVLVLAGPSTRSSTPVPGRAAFLFDVSRSVSRADREAAVDHARGVLSRSGEAATVTIAAFAGGERVLYDGPTVDLEVDQVFQRIVDGAELDELDSDPTHAFTALFGREGDGEDVVRYVYTDGALPSPRELGAPAGRTIFVPADDSGVRNSRIVAVDVPSSVLEGAGFPLSVVYDASDAIAASLELVVDGVVRRTVEADLVAGSGRVEFEGLELGLEPGRHEIVARLVGDDAEPLDDAAGAILDVLPERHVLYVRGEHRGERAPAFARALRAQGLDVREAVGLGDADWTRVSAVVLDRVAVDGVSAAAADAVVRFVRDGGGLLLFPREDEGELLRWNSHPLAAALPLNGTPAPPPPEPDEDREEDDEPPRKKSEADPDRKKTEEIDAPTLIMVLLIDKSRSMKDDSRLHYAKRAAIATARQLHPEDFVGVISYNEGPTEVVPVRPAGDRDEIERAIMRIRPSGGTDIESALMFVKETLDREEAAIKTVILLSDGVTRPFNIKGVAESLVASGISLNTIGVGSSFDVSTLTLIAKYGRGTGPIPARRSAELPSILIDVASRIMQKHGTRTAEDAGTEEREDDDIVRPEIPEIPEPGTDTAEAKRADEAAERNLRPIVVGRFVSYLAGIPWELSPRLEGLHLSAPKDGAWVSLVTEPPAPVLAHWRVGEGTVAMAVIPPEGAWSRDLALWDAYAPWAGQLVRFLSRDPGLMRYDVAARFEDGSVRVTVVDTWSRREASGWTFRGADRDLATTELGDGTFLVELESPSRGEAIVHLDATSPDGETLAIALPSEPPLEVRTRGLDLGRLEEWRRAVGGELVAEDAPAPRDGERVEARLDFGPLLLVLIIGFAIDLIAKRLLRREA